MHIGSCGLVLEGGAMRGMFTAGVLDVFMENDLWFDNAVGISAGAVFGCNYKSAQIGRTIRYNKRFCRNRDYCSLYSLIRTGDLYGADFGYRRIPFELDVFDTKTFTDSPMNFYAGATDMDTGKCHFHKCTTGLEEDLLFLRASASMPLVSRIVEINGHGYLDGGCSDPIALDFMEGLGFDHNVVLLTQPAGFVKEKNSMLPLMRLKYGRKYPAFMETMEKRHIVYNRTLRTIDERVRAGRVFVIQPPQALNIKAVEKDENNLERVYQIGRKTGAGVLEPLMEFVSRLG